MRNKAIEHEIVTPLHFFMLPDWKDAIVYDGGVAVYSNIESDDTATGNTPVYKELSSFPMRLMMTTVIICRTGGFRLRCNLHDYEINAGEGIIIIPGSIIESYDVDSGSQTCIATFTRDMAVDALPLSEGLLEQIDFVSPVLVQVNEQQMELLIQLMHTLRHCVAMPEAEARRVAVGACVRIFTCQLQQCTKIERKETGKRVSRNHIIFGKYVRDVFEHFREERNLKFYADRQFITPKYLSAAVMQASGRKAYDILCDLVILEAKELLRTPGITVQRVAVELNFPTHSFFSKFFKARTNMTPMQYVQSKE